MKLHDTAVLSIVTLALGATLTGQTLAAQPAAPAATSAPATQSSGSRALPADAAAIGPFLTALDVPPLWPADLDALDATIKAALAKTPKDPAVLFSAAMLKRARGDRATALEDMKELIKLAPNVAEYHFRYGTLEFETISGMLEAGSKGGRGRDAMIRTIELDPQHVFARVGLFQFYLQAPWIAGGSSSKAKAQCDELLALPDGRGEYQGRLLLAQYAASDEEWEEMSKQFTLAESARGIGASKLSAIGAHALALLDRKEDPAAAQALLARAAELDTPNETTLPFARGRVAMVKEDYAAAAQQFTTVLERNEGARSSRFMLAESLEKLGKKAEAAQQYEEFAKRFPGDNRAEKATSTAKRLRR
jgi:tetratricopeptide (TPR) repeat protein